MKQHYLKGILLCLSLFIGLNASAYDAFINGIYYNFSGDEAEVTNNGSGSYSGDVVIPSSVTYSNKTYTVTSIGQDAFYYCEGLTSVTIPNSVTSIGQSAFSECWALTSITFPNSVTSIGQSAFSKCWALTSITIPNSVTSIGEDAFRGCESLTSIKVETGNTSYDSRNNCNAIIETASNTLIVGCQNTVIPNSVTSIGNNAFYYCSGLTSITIPDGVTSIGKCAFENCSSLTSVTIGDGVTSIGNGAFSDCSSLTSITIPNSVTSIGGGAFWGCSGLTSITIPASVTYIEGTVGGSNLSSIVVENGNTVYDSRNNCNAIIETSTNTLIEGCDNTIIPNTVKRIEGGAFYDCKEISSLTIPEGVTSIGYRAFTGCDNLTSVTLPETLETIDGEAFNSCAISSIVLPSSLTSIGGYAFIGCPNLTSITIPKNVTHIGWGAFRNLTTIVVDSDNTSFDSRDHSNAIIETSSNTLIVGCRNTIIPNTVTSIGCDAFTACEGLTSIIIPSSVTYIQGSAFCGCTDLTSVIISENVERIDGWAFLDCSSLVSVMVKNPVPVTIEENTFTNRSNATLYVPVGSKAAYEAADYWKDFKEIIETITINVGSTGFATYCSSYPLDFSEVSGLNAYIASGFSPSTAKLVLTRVTEVPAGEGLYLVGEPGTYKVATTETDMIYSNLLKGVTNATTIYPTDGSYTNFILANGSHGVAFYSLSEAGELAAGKAYLQLPTASVSEVKAISVIFDDDEDAIQSIAEESQTERIYNLQGQQVNAPKSGLYIVNGKKVFIK